MPIHPRLLSVTPEARQWDKIKMLERQAELMRRQNATNIQRGYAENLTFTGIGAAGGAQVEMVTIDLELVEEDRLLMWGSAELSADDGTSITVWFNDSGGAVSDFADEDFPLATFTGTAGFTGPSYVAPAIPQINLLGSGPIPLPNGKNTGNVQSGNASVGGAIGSGYFPTAILPYNADPPTEGLHTFRLTASRTSPTGACQVDNVKLWLAIV